MFSDMHDEAKCHLFWALAITVTISSVAWAIAFTSVNGAPPPKRTTMETCAYFTEARNSTFCLEVARGQRS